MRRTRLLCVLLLVCGSAIVAANQAPASLPLPDSLGDHVRNERYGIVSSLRGLPLGVREALQKLFGSQTLDITDAFGTATPDGASTSATRRLVAAGCADDNHCIVYYERRGSTPSWHVALFQWDPAATTFEWGGMAPGNLKTVDDVRKAMLSGAIKGPSTVW